MTHGQLAEHGADHAVEVAAAGEVGQERLIFSPHGVPVRPVHVRGIEKVSVDPPCLVEHLGPLGPGLDPDRDRGESRQCAVSLLELARIDDSAFGQAHFEAPLTALAGFLLRTFQVIPAGREGEFINLDGELNQLLRRS